MKVSLSIKDRILIEQFLPEQDNLLNLLIRKTIVSAVVIGIKEMEACDLTRTDTGSITWDSTKEKPLKIEFTPKQVEYIKGVIQRHGESEETANYNADSIPEFLVHFLD